jgi:hypothetical protein
MASLQYCTVVSELNLARRGSILRDQPTCCNRQFAWCQALIRRRDLHHMHASITSMDEAATAAAAGNDLPAPAAASAADGLVGLASLIAGLVAKSHGSAHAAAVQEQLTKQFKLYLAQDAQLQALQSTQAQLLQAALADIITQQQLTPALEAAAAGANGTTLAAAPAPAAAAATATVATAAAAAAAAVAVSAAAAPPPEGGEGDGEEALLTVFGVADSLTRHELRALAVAQRSSVNQLQVALTKLRASVRSALQRIQGKAARGGGGGDTSGGAIATKAADVDAATEALSQGALHM